MFLNIIMGRGKKMNGTNEMTPLTLSWRILKLATRIYIPMHRNS